MTGIRKKYPPVFKAQLVQEMLREEEPITQIASRHGVHPNLLRRWKERALSAMPENFADEERFQKRLALLSAEHEKEKESLYAEIGRLQTERNWLEKKIRGLGIPLGAGEIDRAHK